MRQEPHRPSSNAAGRVAAAFCRAVALLAAGAPLSAEDELLWLAPGEVVWRGALTGLDPRPERPVLELAPDGRSFVYLQGPPWPRLMLQPLEPAGAAPRMLGTLAPFGERAPRFDPEGGSIYFTADLGWRPRRPRPPGELPENAKVQTAVFRAGLDGAPPRRLAPSAGAAEDASAVFLDLHPDGRTLLIGEARGLKAFDVETGNFEIRLAELYLETSRPLDFAIAGKALARYSSDGRSIYYTPQNPFESGVEARRYDRPSGIHQRLTASLERFGARAGDLEAATARFAHPGSFNWDGYPATLLRQHWNDPPIFLEVPEGFPGSDVASPRPIAFRGDRVLFACGLRDKLEVVAAAWRSEDFVTLLTRARQDPDAPRWRDAALTARLAAVRARSPLRARADGDARRLLESLERTLIRLPGAPVEALRARWKRVQADAGLNIEQRVTAVETSSGLLRIEKVLPPEKPEDVPPAEVLAYDGEKARYTAPDGKVFSIPEEALEEELATHSPYRLLLDPAGLADAGLSFRLLPRAEGAPPEERALAFRHRDGFSGVLFLRDADGETVPARIESPLLFAAHKTRASFGALPPSKVLRFEEFRPAGGRLVPHRIRFQGGLSDFTLELLGLEFNVPLEGAPFQEP